MGPGPRMVQSGPKGPTVKAFEYLVQIGLQSLGKSAHPDQMGTNFGTILEPFWDHLGPFWDA